MLLVSDMLFGGHSRPDIGTKVIGFMCLCGQEQNIIPFIFRSTNNS